LSWRNYQGNHLGNFKNQAIVSDAPEIADALSCIDQCFIADEMLKQLPAASRVGKTIVGGIDLNKARMRRVIEALLASSSSPNGFTASEVGGPGTRTQQSKTHCSTVPATLLMI
jgi:hypothetical protein